MSDAPDQKSQKASAGAFVAQAMRENAIALWGSAADIAEWVATDMESGGSRMVDGPEACRQLAEFFRQMSGSLDEAKPTPSWYRQLLNRVGGVR